MKKDHFIITCIAMSAGLMAAKLFCNAQASWILVFFPIWFPCTIGMFFIITAVLGFYIYDQKQKRKQNG